LGVSVSALHATPYATNVFNTAGNSWQFTLNAPANDVTVLRNGANPVDLGPLTAGAHTFDMTGFSSFNIQVKNSAPDAWTSISDPSNAFDDFTFPNGVAINQNATDLKYFGTVYVANANGVQGAAGTAVSTASGRAMGDGIYALTSDMKGVNLPAMTPVASANDTSQAKVVGLDVVAGGTSAPNRISLDAAGNVIISDWSDASGGVKYMSKDLSTGGRVLAGVQAFTPTGTTPDPTPLADGLGNGPAGGIYSTQQDAIGSLPLHGSVVSKVYTTGSVGNNLTIYTMDEDLDLDLSAPNNDTNSIWRYNVGNATEFESQAPTVVVKSTSIPAVSDGGVNFIGAFGGGVRADMLYDPTHQQWIITNGRSSGNQSNGSSVIIVKAALDGSQAGTPQVVWSSRQFTIDNSLDADTADPTANDIFRRVGQVALSPDGKFLIMHRTGSDVAYDGIAVGDLLVVPLDANGIPMINVSGGLVTNVTAFSEIGGQGAHTTSNSVEFDAAGNLYVANSSVTAGLIGQDVQVFSPGGNWIASTNSDGTFTMTAITGGVAGDYNGDGVVDAADYVVWRSAVAAGATSLPNRGTGISGTVGTSDYTFWKAHFGATSGSGSSVQGAAVPEPATLAMVLLGLMASGFGRKRRATK
jgi:hypothetical protein